MYIIWPSLGSMLFVILFPFLGIPIFLRTKRVIYSKYENGFINTSKKTFSLKTFLFRSFNVFLLCIGFNAALIGSGIIDQSLLVNNVQLIYLQSHGIEVQYSTDGFLGFTSALLPIAVGLLSIGWKFKDAGIIHFKLPEENMNELFEIEPIHYRYEGYIKGFAGISAILYYIDAIIYYVFYHPTYENFLPDLIFLSIFGFLFIISTIPAHLIYQKIGNKHFRKHLKAYKPITRSEFEK